MVNLDPGLFLYHASGMRAESFAGHFIEKIRLKVGKTILNPGVNNGKNKLIVACRDFIECFDVTISVDHSTFNRISFDLF